MLSYEHADRTCIALQREWSKHFSDTAKVVDWPAEIFEAFFIAVRTAFMPGAALCNEGALLYSGLKLTPGPAAPAFRDFHTRRTCHPYLPI